MYNFSSPFQFLVSRQEKLSYGIGRKINELLERKSHFILKMRDQIYEQFNSTDKIFEVWAPALPIYFKIIS